MKNGVTYSFSPDIPERTQGHKLTNVLSFPEKFLPKALFRSLEM
jgi:hypothetical protein